LFEHGWKGTCLKIHFKAGAWKGLYVKVSFNIKGGKGCGLKVSFIMSGKGVVKKLFLAWLERGVVHGIGKNCSKGAGEEEEQEQYN
jgi:hypothetical protein